MERDLMFIGSFFAFGMGAVIASFLNVVIWRTPRGESIVSPPSHCPKCNAPIRWYQNIPILSWLALRGRCANCREPISPRYILIEILGAVLFLGAFWRCGLDPWAILSAWIWISLMIVGSMIDYDLKLLPDFVTVGDMILGDSLVGLALGFGLLWLVRFLGTKAFKREAMGLGDVFLMGAVGAMHGPVAVLFTLIVSSVLGSVVGVGLVAASKTKFGKFLEIPYGPYICLADLIWFFAGPEIVEIYLSLLR